MIVDAIVALVMIGSTAIAFFRGFIRESLTILGVGGGLAAAVFLGPALRPVVSSWLTNTSGGSEKFFGVVPLSLMEQVISYGIVFVIVVAGLSFLSHSISKWAKTAGLGAVDRSLGVVFGLARGVLILGLLYAPVYYLVDAETRNEKMADSRSHFYLESTAGFILSLLPSDELPGDVGQSMQEAAHAAGTSARNKLKNMDFLPDTDTMRGNAEKFLNRKKEESGQNRITLSPEEAQRLNEQGYPEQDREVLEQLFKEEYND